MVERVRIGVIGAGLIAQWEHIPNLVRLADRFLVAGVCDPSAAARNFVARQFGLRTFPDSDSLLGESLDAVLIASPDFTHVAETLKALTHRLHVFCEKPLCYGPAEADAIIAARDKAGMVVQVGYMKRFDPSYEACLELLPDDPARLRYVAVEVNDPDSWPFAEIHPHALVNDLPEALLAEGKRAKAAQVAAALGIDAAPAVRNGFAGSYSSSLVHDVNATFGLLDRLGVPDGEIIGATFFADGGGGLGTVGLLGGDAVWQMTHLAVPGVADYQERIALYFDERIVELAFPSPYLNHSPTRLTIRQSDGRRLETREIRPGFGEAFVRELEAFWSSIATGAPVRNSVEQAKRDQALLCALARHAAGRGIHDRRASTDSGIRPTSRSGLTSHREAVA
ncbi:MAG: Gfo/Idh/MocA family oxidoreductase [Bauldia sp.]|nr:MAG: Gfo/Idh/MocA family oxidoreductase [Bauldia sp.]